MTSPERIKISPDIDSTEELPFQQQLRRLKTAATLALHLAPYAAGFTVVGSLTAEQAWQHGAFGLPPLQWVDTSGHIQHIDTNGNGKTYVMVPPHTVITLGENGSLHVAGHNADPTQQDHVSTLTILNSTDSSELIPIQGQPGQELVAAAQADNSHDLYLFPGQQEQGGTSIGSDNTLQGNITKVNNELNTRRGHLAQGITTIVEEITESTLPLIAKDEPHQIIDISASSSTSPDQ